MEVVGIVAKIIESDKPAKVLLMLAVLVLAWLTV
jgi:hypothetical protein